MLAIDVSLAFDNALVIGAVAAKLPIHLRRKAILIGVCAAFVFRILFAGLSLKLLTVVGLTLAGGLLLLWVAWKLWREISGTGLENAEKGERPQNLRQAVIQILAADISMSLDNTLAVAGAARNHFWILVFGLLASLGLMGIASSFIAKISQRHRWVSYVGLLIVVYVAASMIYDGVHEILNLRNV